MTTQSISVQDADPHQSSAEHRDRPSDIANFIRLRRELGASLRKYDRLNRAYCMEDRTSFAETALLVAEPDWYHRRSSSESFCGHASRSEHLGPNSGQTSPEDEQSENPPSGEENVEDHESNPAWLLFLKINPRFKVLRQEFAEAIKKVGLNDFGGAKWQDTLEGVCIYDVVMFKKHKLVEEPDTLCDEDLSWAPCLGGRRMRTVTCYAIVDDIPDHQDYMNLRDLTTFEDIPGSPERGQKAFDNVSGKMRFALEDYLHVVAHDSEGSVMNEPRCFQGGLQCAWLSIDGVPPPSVKNWYMDTVSPYTVQNIPICVVGEVRESDYETLALVREASFDRANKRRRQQLATSQAGNTAGNAIDVTENDDSISNDPLERSRPEKPSTGSRIPAHDKFPSSHRPISPINTIPRSDGEQSMYAAALEENAHTEYHVRAGRNAMVERLRQEFPDFRDEDWQDSFEHVHAGDVIMFKHVDVFGQSDRLAEDDGSRAPMFFGAVQINVRLAVVGMKIDKDHIDVLDLTTFKSISGSPQRRDKVLDRVSGKMRYALEDYLHAIALDSQGQSPIDTEPRCFRGGIQCKWRSINGAPRPSSKNWYMATFTHTLADTHIHVVGRVAGSADLDCI